MGPALGAGSQKGDCQWSLIHLINFTRRSAIHQNLLLTRSTVLILHLEIAPCCPHSEGRRRVSWDQIKGLAWCPLDGTASSTHSGVAFREMKGLLAFLLSNGGFRAREAEHHAIARADKRTPWATLRERTIFHMSKASPKVHQRKLAVANRISLRGQSIPDPAGSIHAATLTKNGRLN